MFCIAGKLVSVSYTCQTLRIIPARCRAAEIKVTEGPTSLQVCDLRDISQQVAALLGDGPVKGLSSKTLQSNAPWSIVLLLATGP